MLANILKDADPGLQPLLIEDHFPIPGPSRPTQLRDILPQAEIQKIMKEDQMEVQSGNMFEDYDISGFSDYSWILKPLPAPSVAIRFAAGELPPYLVLDQKAALYISWYKKQQIAIKALKFLCGISSALAGLAVFKSILQWAITPRNAECAQAVITTSGGTYETKPTRRTLQPRRPDKFRRMELLEASDSYGWQSSNGPLVQSKIVKNISIVRNGSRQVNGMFVFGHVIMLPLHIFDAVDTDTLAIVLPNSITFQLHMQDLTQDEVMVCENRHLVFINLARQLTYYHAFSDLRCYFLDFKQDTDYIARLGYMCTMRPDSEYTAMLYQIPLSDIQPDCNEASIKDQKFQHVYTIIKSLRAHVRSAKGDCGSLWVLDRGSNGGAKIAGVHIAGEPTLELGRAAILTRKMIDHVAQYFRHGEPKLPKINHSEQTLLPNIEQLQSYDAIDILGTADIKFHQSSRTDLRPSLWDGIRPHTTAPAKLKGFLHPNGEYLIPQIVSFKRYAGERRGIPDAILRRATSYLSDWYPSAIANERRVLSIEEAIFGEADGLNPSIKTDTSLGYPWNLSYKKRTQLFTLQPQWISDELRQACQKVMDTGELDMIIIDSLKDERVSMEKAMKGDTRIFMILPFHVNIVLKQLYGDFIHYLQKRWPISPVKIGISPLPDDWTTLTHWLIDNEGELIAGDYGGWDRKVHYEVMMAIVDWINEWYADDKQHLRKKICQQIFQAYHFLYGTIYRSDGGMPSGCYLTTPFNSLANVLYWYVFMLTTLPEEKMVGHTYWFRPAVYGDDHVISVRDHPTINAQTFGTWITSLGLRYTDALKNIPEKPYQKLGEISFLKRAFVVRQNRVWAPLEEKQLYEMVQWYRDSPATRILSRRELARQILETVLSEAYFHGREFFNSFHKELIDYVNNRAALDLTDTPFSYDFFEKRFMGDEVNVTNWTSFGTWSLVPRLCNERLEANDTELPNESPQQALSHVETSVSPDLDVSSGLQATPSDPVSNARVVADTLISDPQAVVETSALSQYRDAQRVDTLNLSSSIVPVVDANFVFPRGYFEMAERSIPITTLIIPMTTPTPYPLYRLDPLNVILGSNIIKNKLNYARYLRFEMEIQIKILATNFHYGQLMAVFRPAYFPFLKLQRVYDEGDHFTHCKVLKDNWNATGPYDTVFTASQLPHTVIPITAGNSVTIHCPWALNFQYAPVSELLSPRFHLGILDIYSITEVAPTDADSPTLQIFARLANIQGFGYQSAGDVCLPPPAALITTNKYMMEDGTEDSFFRIPIHMPSAGNIMNRIQARESLARLSATILSSTVVARWNGSSVHTLTQQYHMEMKKQFGSDESKWTPMRKWLDKYENKDLTDKKERLEAGELSEILNRESSTPIHGLFSTIDSFIGGAKQLLGLSKPLSDSPMNRVINVAPPIANAVGEDFTLSTSYHSQCEVHKPRKLHSDKTQLSTLAATPTFVGYVKFTTTDRIASFSIAPHTIITNAWKDAYVMMPAGYIASRFAYWRGALKYWLHFSSSSFINARFQITVAFRNVRTQPGIVPTQYVEIKGDAVAKGIIPFVWQTQWADFMSEDYEWTINIRLQDGTPVAWKKDEATPIMCSVWFAFQDFQVAQPALNLCQGIPWGFAKYFEGTHPVDFSNQTRYIPRPPLHDLISKKPLPKALPIPPRPFKEELQSLDLPGTIPVKESFDVGMNDIPSSVYHIAKLSFTGMVPGKSRLWSSSLNGRGGIGRALGKGFLEIRS
uniref:Polyprotein n=1 Tax=Fesavirus 1 TaxID=1530450 RepID=A0A076JYY4_9VIRU|nr:polyprotein [Fesavirus 1]